MAFVSGPMNKGLVSNEAVVLRRCEEVKDSQRAGFINCVDKIKSLHFPGLCI